MTKSTSLISVGYGGFGDQCRAAGDHVPSCVTMCTV